MIKINIFNLCVLAVFNSCGISQSNQAMSKVKESIILTLNNIVINHYENDSLNNSRALVLPIMYYDFEVINHSIDTFGIKLAVHGHYDKLFDAFVVFNVLNKRDTLVLSNFANRNKILFLPQDTTNFIIKGFIPDLEEYLDIMSAKELMEKIAKYGEVVFRIRTFNDPNKIPVNEIVRKSDDFKIEFRDPNDTAVE